MVSVEDVLRTLVSSYKSQIRGEKALEWDRHSLFRSLAFLAYISTEWGHGKGSGWSKPDEGAISSKCSVEGERRGQGDRSYSLFILKDCGQLVSEPSCE